MILLQRPSLYLFLYHFKSKRSGCAFACASFVLLLNGCQSVPNDIDIEPPNVIRVEHQNIFTLQPSMCFDDPKYSDTITDRNNEMTISAIKRLDCSEPHDNEVFHAYNLSNETYYDNTEALIQGIDVQCETAFSDYVGQPVDETPYNISYIMPTQESWGIGDREVLCFAYHSTGFKLTDSVRYIMPLSELL